ncbi:hypothetical protein ACJX0J_011675 [Zea mays]
MNKKQEIAKKQTNNGRSGDTDQKTFNMNNSMTGHIDEFSVGGGMLPREILLSSSAQLFRGQEGTFFKKIAVDPFTKIQIKVVWNKKGGGGGRLTITSRFPIQTSDYILCLADTHK